jgi:cell wall-associated NlpC family hydrolase
MKKVNKMLCAVAMLSALTLSGCYAPQKDVWTGEDEDVVDVLPPYEGGDDYLEEGTEEVGGDGDNVGGSEGDVGSDEEGAGEADEPIVDETPTPQMTTYIKVTGENVNLRTGAGTNYVVAGVAEKNTLYAALDKVGDWYKTYYKNSVVYISAKYCVAVQIERADDKIENVIAEGTRYMGVKYVYGATRYHDGNGNLIKGFTSSAFDCSSLMQYIFYKGAGVNLQVTTRTQIHQGTTVKKSQLKRGDLIFFTNESRKNNSGVERVGHVALYLGDNLILHTASDYAKIESISAARWAFYIQAQRVV